tara:strand:+ start:631 stop:1203 length:573 start_codon:yes stop_codon:yes gene_type:complete
MNQYTNQILKLKILPQLGKGRKSRNSINAAVRRLQTEIILRRTEEVLKKQKEQDSRLAQKDKALESLELDKFDRNFDEFTVKYEAPKVETEEEKEEVQKPIIARPAPIPQPLPTPEEKSLFREYNSKGIFFKTNLKAVTNRDDNGNVLITIGEDIAESVSINNEKPVKIETIPAPQSGHLKIPLTINRSE